MANCLTCGDWKIIAKLACPNCNGGMPKYKQSALEIEALRQIKLVKIQTPFSEFPTGYGKTRFDFAWPFLELALEVEGGTWANGRHSRGVGYTNDVKKYNAAQLAGWVVIRVTTDMIKKGEAIDIIEQAFKVCSEKARKR